MRLEGKPLDGFIWVRKKNIELFQSRVTYRM